MTKPKNEVWILRLLLRWECCYPFLMPLQALDIRIAACLFLLLVNMKIDALLADSGAFDTRTGSRHGWKNILVLILATSGLLTVMMTALLLWNAPSFWQPHGENFEFDTERFAIVLRFMLIVGGGTALMKLAGLGGEWCWNRFEQRVKARAASDSSLHRKQGN